MNEKEWVNSIFPKIEESLRKENDKIRVFESEKILYRSYIESYANKMPIYPLLPKFNHFETDILISEKINENEYKPRIIIEAKINSISTHNAITYSQKAKAHKILHPYLRYGLLIGNRNEKALPGRLLRHGHHFDFMQSFKKFKADKEEWNSFIEILKSEYMASLLLDEIYKIVAVRGTPKITSFHKQLIIKKQIQ